ncbi:phosphoglycerate mutase family protein [Gordonia sp. PP30]|uniref:histidine phosphatase family protein n=1 Tax=unclassified Gordonia (in: high G+C Gram-positive bacteria) TaxID=2657482 RepID=UPI00200020B4|nr:MULTISPECIES: histidine phosphatase family protein [unclassified Gordonia (in: high G+C Gram-positive bacteria)]UQE74950.1 phosphoglycerate mutase family protein [Gordonia sp. PP30]
MGVIYLVRHGQAPLHAYSTEPAPGNAPGLTELGFEQARRTGLALAGQVPAFTAAVSGALPRQRATLGAVLDAFGTVHAGDAPERVVDAGWDEYVIPALPGGPTPDLYDSPAAYQQLLDDALLRWTEGAGSGASGPNGVSAAQSDETYAEYLARTSAAADRAVALAGSGQTVLAVSSAGTITALIARLWGVPAQSWPALARAMVNASYSKLLVGRRGITVVSVNEHAHLSASDVGLATFR